MQTDTRSAVVRARVTERQAAELRRMADENASTVSRIVARAVARDLARAHTHRPAVSAAEYADAA